MRVEVHILFYQEDWLFPYILRHYLSFADKLVIHDGGGKLPPERYFQGGVFIEPWDCPEVNDLKYMNLRNNCWKGTGSDWVIVADSDEFILFPQGAEKTLSTYSRIGAAVIRPHGFEMFSETLPTGGGQIYDEIRQGAPEDKWYAKPILFSPARVADMGLGVGSHEADPVLLDGRRFHAGKEWPFANPPAYLLHYHQIGPAVAIAARYDGNVQRMCAANKANRWGNFKPGMEHVAEKRAAILPNLRDVIS